MAGHAAARVNVECRHEQLQVHASRSTQTAVMTLVLHIQLLLTMLLRRVPYLLQDHA
jgi:hypothetical protein